MSTNVHSFSTTFNKNGNITISFYEATKQRHIKLPKGSKAAATYHKRYHDVFDVLDDETSTDYALSHLREDYIFKKHPNNPSVFYPKPRLQTA